ncbi:MAG: beta-galactosidase [Tannerella sp.]|nr:beta-galactosidase [Tannerella sp.]
MKKTTIVGLFAVAGFLFFSVGGASQTACPFGVSMHIDGGAEYNQMPENLRMLRAAGIRWVRTDFVWSSIEGPQGVWHFDAFDRVVAETEKEGLQLLGLLLYNVSWANPAYEHPEAWLTYVEKVVTRYKGKVRYWEIWNEPNLHPRFWDRRNDAAGYAQLLKATYRKIKEIDPDVTVVHAGTAGIPTEYIEQSFAAGSGRFFDKFAVHPYRPRLDTWEATEQFREDIDNLRALMTKYGIEQKDIWFTEIGISTMTGVEFRDKEAFHEAKKETGRDWKVALVCDDDFPVDASFSGQIRTLFPSGFRLDSLQLLDLRRVHPEAYDAVFFPPTDNFPLHVSQTVTPYLTRYLRGGGKVYYCTKDGTVYYYGDAAEKEKNQAAFIAQTLLLSLRFGIERYFCYEFESSEENIFDREDNFGLTHRGLRPKPAYYAYAAAGKLFPEGSVIDTSVAWKQKECCVVSWQQPDGLRVWAVWSPEGVRQVNVKIGKGLKQALNQSGEMIPSVTEATETLEIKPAVTYLTGAATLDIQ